MTKLATSKKLLTVIEMGHTSDLKANEPRHS